VIDQEFVESQSYSLSQGRVLWEKLRRKSKFNERQDQRGQDASSSNDTENVPSQSNESLPSQNQQCLGSPPKFSWDRYV
jgi:hypothetical protein